MLDKIRRFRKNDKKNTRKKNKEKKNISRVFWSPSAPGDKINNCFFFVFFSI